MEQVSIPGHRGEIRGGGVVADVHQSGVHLLPLQVGLTVELGRAEQLPFLPALGQSGQVEKVGLCPQALGQQAHIFVGVVVADGDARTAQQGTDGLYRAVPPGLLFQYGHHLADKVAPADAHPACAQTLQQINGCQGQGLVGLAVAACIGAEDYIPQRPADTGIRATDALK